MRIAAFGRRDVCAAPLAPCQILFDGVALRCHTLNNMGSGRRRPVIPGRSFLQPVIERTRCNKVAEATERIRCVETRPSLIAFTTERYLLIVVVSSCGGGESLSEFIL